MIEIRDSKGMTVVAVPVTEGCVCRRELMKDDQVRLSFDYPEALAFAEGAYVEYGGRKYTLPEPARPTRKDEGTYSYELVFESEVMGWKKLPLFYTEQGSTGVETDWSATFTPAQFLSEVTANILRFTGKVYTYSYDAALEGTQSLQFQTTSVFDGLTKIAQAWETEWWVEGDVIHLSKCKYGAPVTLEVGYNIGIPSVTANKDGYYTRFYVFGSTRNITQDYNDGSVTSHITKKRLKLPAATCPGGYKDIRPDLKPGGIFVKTLIFDDIYPSAELPVSGVRMELRTDKTKQVGTDEDGNPVYETYPVFYFKIADLVFSKDNLIAGMPLSVRFLTGTLAGREFQLNYNPVKEEYEILFDESAGFIVPNLTLAPVDGNEVALFNMRMPSGYVAQAESRLERALDEEITRRLTDRDVRQFNSNPCRFAIDGTDLEVGRAVLFKDGDLTIATRVISVEKRLDDVFSQSVQIGEEKIYGTTRELKEEVVNVSRNVDVIQSLGEVSREVVNAYSRAQKEIADGLSHWKDMWIFDKSLDTTADKTDATKWVVKIRYDLVSEKGVSAYGFSGSPNGVVASALSELTDVGLSDLGTGQVLQYDGTKWVNKMAVLTGKWEDITGKPSVFPTNWANVSGKPDLDATYLKLIGGTMTGNLVAKNIIADAFFANKSNVSWNLPEYSGLTMLTASSDNSLEGSPGPYYSALSVLTSYVGFQLATRGDMLEDLMFRKQGDAGPNHQWTPWREIWHSGNSNTSAVNWNCGQLYANGWLRTLGDAGWYSQKYSGGIWMTDTTWVRVYGGKKFYVENSEADAICTSGGFRSGSAYYTHVYKYASIRSGGNEICITGETSMHVNYQSDGIAPKIWFWRDGTSTGWSDHYFGNVIANRNILSYGEITAYSASDKRLKENSKPLDGLGYLRGLQAYEFDWNDKARELTGSDRTHGFGYFAQDVRLRFPDFTHGIYNSEYLGVRYESFIPLFGAAISQLDAKQDEHERRIAGVERENIELRSENRELKQLLDGLNSRLL